jgi:hypothetical protein
VAPSRPGVDEKIQPAKTTELKDKIDQLEKELERFTQDYKNRIQELKNILAK